MDQLTLQAEIRALSKDFKNLGKRIDTLKQENHRVDRDRLNQSSLIEEVRKRTFGFKRNYTGKNAEEKPSEIEKAIREKLFGPRDPEAIQSPDENIEPSPEELTEIEEQTREAELINLETQLQLEATVRRKLFGPSLEEVKEQKRIEAVKRSHCMKSEYVTYRKLFGSKFGGTPICSTAPCREGEPCPFE